MKNNKSIKLIAAIIMIGFMIMGCGHTVKTKDVKVHCYKGKRSGGNSLASNTSSDNAGNDLLFWYIMFANNNSYYYYSSPTPVTNFSTVTFVSSTGFPPIVNDAGKTLTPEEEISEIDVNANEIADNIETELSPTETVEVETAESGPAEAESGNDEGSTGPSEGSSSDAGASDAGGDSGGGDGGGGGD